jgi:hypothetical protein
MRRKTKIFLIIAALLLLAGSYFLILKTAPKNASYFPILLILAGLDIALWNSIRTLLKRSVRAFRIPFSILYWSPATILLLSLLASWLFESYNASSPVIIYLMGFVFIMYVSKLVPGLLVLFTSATGLLIRLTRRIIRPKDADRPLTVKGLRIFNYTGYGIGVIMLGLLTLGIAVWGYDFRIVEHHLSIHDLPDAFRGIRIVQISDMHLGSWPSEKKLETVVLLVNDLTPDLVLFTGDLVNSRTVEADPYRSVLKKINAELGVYTILGNHDYGDYASWDSPELKQKNMTDLYSYFDEIGWKLLCNSHDIIHLDGDSMAVAGVENWSIYDRFECRGDLDKTMKGLSNTPMIILMTHDPSHWEKAVISEYPGIDLTLTGHTHGFQFGIETSHLKWSPVQWLYDEWAGLYEYTQAGGQKQYMYVNRGLGAIGYPGRVGIKPEITLFVLN